LFAVVCQLKSMLRKQLINKKYLYVECFSLMIILSFTRTHTNC
jgi:hypothetical protein